MNGRSLRLWGLLLWRIGCQNGIEIKRYHLILRIRMRLRRIVLLRSCLINLMKMVQVSKKNLIFARFPRRWRNTRTLRTKRNLLRQTPSKRDIRHSRERFERCLKLTILQATLSLRQFPKSVQKSHESNKN